MSSSGLHNPAKPPGAYSYCGPTALAILTGCSIEHMNTAVADLRQSGKSCASKDASRDSTKIKTTWWGELTTILRNCGKSVTPTSVSASKRYWSKTVNGESMRSTFNMSPTLATFARKQAKKGVNYLIRVTEHFVVLRDGHVYDTFGFEIPISKSTHKRKRISDFTPVGDRCDEYLASL